MFWKNDELMICVLWQSWLRGKRLVTYFIILETWRCLLKDTAATRYTFQMFFALHRLHDLTCKWKYVRFNSRKHTYLWIKMANEIALFVFKIFLTFANRFGNIQFHESGYGQGKTHWLTEKKLVSWEAAQECKHATGAL